MKYFKLIALFLLPAVVLAYSLKEKAITGVVTDENQNPIEHATVQEVGTQNSTGTDEKGRFSLNVKSGNAKLMITAAGFNQKEIKLNNATHVNIALKSTSVSLDEVVVIGYGTQKKANLTFGVTGVSEAASSIGIRGAAQLASPHMEPVGNDWRNNPNYNREGYDGFSENPFLKSTDNPLSTFSIDVDGASYSNIRRFINNGQLPPEGAVRIEEMINYFSYIYPQPSNDDPFSINTEYAVCPWNSQHQLVSVGLQGKKIATESLPPANIVFLIDVSGSMSDPNKLPLVQSSMKLLADQLRPQDKVAMVVYAGNAGVVLPSTEGNRKSDIKNAIDRLQAGGSTAGGAGIQLAYKIAKDHFIQNGNNRIVLCTDGDFNVGQSSDDELERMIEEKRKSGIFLTVLGFGTGNYQDAKMQKLADKGNGNHAYIDNLNEARKVLISQFGGTLFTIAKDVKLQVEFNPAKVQGYRLIGYENRMLAKEDFNDDAKDAGELGSGHTVTALYEIIPTGIDAPELKKVDGLKYQKIQSDKPEFSNSNEVMTVKFRYKKPDDDKSLLLQKIISGAPVDFNSASANIHLAAGLAQFGMLLRNSEYKGNGGYQLAINLVSGTEAEDSEGYRAELLKLMKKASNFGETKNEEVGYFNSDKKKPSLQLMR